MSADPMKLVKFVCVAPTHAGGRSATALTIHDGTWAFCPMGADHQDHVWQQSDGLPLTDVLRFVPPEAPELVPSAPAAAAKPASPPAPSARGRARPR